MNYVKFSIAILLFVISCTTNKHPVQEILFTDQGKTSEPNLHLTEKNQVLLSWINSNKNHSNLKFSSLNGKQWSDPKIIASGEDWFVNWADFPSLASFGNNLVAHYLDKSAEDTYAYDVKLIASNDNGSSWNTAYKPHHDNTYTEHGFVSKVPITDDSFLTVWLDGRNYSYAQTDSTKIEQMTLRSALIDKNNSIIKKQLIDPRVCDCCQTDLVNTNNGQIVVYRDRTEDEIRDIYYSRRLNGHWTTPKAVYNDNWKIAGCPVNGPSASALNHTVAIAWFTMANGNGEVKVAFSNNNGESFNLPFLIDFNDPIGRVDIELLNDNSAIICWMDIVSDKTVIQLQRIDSNGNKSNILTVSESSQDRSSGFPRMVLNGDLLYMCWTDTSVQPKKVKTVSVDINTLK